MMNYGDTWAHMLAGFALCAVVFGLVYFSDFRSS